MNSGRTSALAGNLAVGIILAALAPIGCGPQTAKDATPPLLLREIEPAPGELSNAALPRVEIGQESRPVVLSEPRYVVSWREPVDLDQPTLRIEIARPQEIAESRRARAEIGISTREHGTTVDEVFEQGLGDMGRDWLREVAWLEPGMPSILVELAVPESLRSRSALLDVIVRPLPESSGETSPIGPALVRAGDVLRFGYGVEDNASTAGWPPVVFFADARTEAASERVFERTLDPATTPADRGWHDAVVDLSALAGQTVTVEIGFRAVEADATDAERGTLAAISNPLIVANRAERSAAGPRNLVLISLDTLRARSLSSYGYARDTSPRMRALLDDQGTRVTRMVAPRPFTPPSHMTMLTGLDPCAHGIEARDQTLGIDHVTLAERLRAEGYDTAAFTENAYVVAAAGFARGFDVYYELRSDESASPGFGQQTFERAADWLDTLDARPFFLFVHTYQVHLPYEPPAAYADLFDGPIPEDDVPEEHRPARNAYDAEIRYTDDLLADFLGALDQRGLSDDTIVIVTSDHGEQFGEHFWTGHGYSAHDEAIVVPFFVRAPGLVQAGRVLELQLGLLDLVPTTLDLLELPVPQDVQGRSFAALLRGENEALARELQGRPIYAGTANGEAVLTDEFKLMRSRNAEKPWQMLYRRSSDPGEKRDVSEQEPELVAAGARLLDEHRRQCEVWRTTHPSRTVDALHGADQPSWLINRDEIEAKLRSLGYVE